MMTARSAVRRIPIPEEVFERGRASHPYAEKCLSAFQSITAICNDCGHYKVLDRERLMGMTAVASFGALWRHAYCAHCRNAGTHRTEVTLHGLLVDRHEVDTDRPKWSDKEVFTEERADPFPTLPRRSRFVCKTERVE